MNAVLISRMEELLRRLTCWQVPSISLWRSLSSSVSEQHRLFHVSWLQISHIPANSSSSYPIYCNWKFSVSHYSWLQMPTRPILEGRSMWCPKLEQTTSSMRTAKVLLPLKRPSSRSHAPSKQSDMPWRLVHKITTSDLRILLVPLLTEDCKHIFANSNGLSSVDFLRVKFLMSRQCT